MSDQNQFGGGPSEQWGRPNPDDASGTGQPGSGYSGAPGYGGTPDSGAAPGYGSAPGYGGTPGYGVPASPAPYPPAAPDAGGYPYGYGQPAANPYPAAYPYAPTASQRNNGLAVASMVVSITGGVLAFCWGVGALFGLVGAILGHVSRRQIRERGEGGAGMALTGVIVGWIALVIGLIVLAIFIAVAVAASKGPSLLNPTPTP